MACFNYYLLDSRMGEDIMQTCEHCKVYLKGNQKVCPLCGGIIQNDDFEREEVFPHIPTIYQEFNILIRTMILLSIIVMVICFAVNLLITRELHWSLYVAAGILCMWLSLYFIIHKKHNIPKTIVWQVALIDILSVLWDASMGWHGWSIDYVLPIVCIMAMIVMAIAAKLLKIGVRDFIIYLFIDIVYGFIPLLFLLFGGLHIWLPSVICVAASAISLAAILLYEGDNMKAELKKRMHI